MVYTTDNNQAKLGKSVRGAVQMKKGTFILEINDTQNQSWQGQIEWVQGRKKENFRSLMELLRLIDSVVGDEEKRSLVDDIV